MGYSPWRPKQSDTTEDSALHTRNSVFTGLEMGLLILPNYYFCHILEKPGNFQTCLEKETVASVDCFFFTKSHRDPLEGEHPDNVPGAYVVSFLEHCSQLPSITSLQSRDETGPVAGRVRGHPCFPSRKSYDLS